MEKLQANIVKIYGKSGEDWLAKLPRSIQQLEHSWGLKDFILVVEAIKASPYKFFLKILGTNFMNLMH